MMQYQEHPFHHRILGPSPSLSCPLSRRQPSNSNHSLYHDPFNHSRPLFHPPNNESCFTSDGGGGVALSMTATSNLSFSPSSFFDKSLSNLPFSSNLNVPRLARYDNCDEDFGYRIGTKPDVGELELPSIQSPATTPATTPSYSVMAPVSSGCATGCEAASCRRSGLLEDLLGESRAMAACAHKIEEILIVNVREKEEEEEEDNYHAQNLAGEEKGMNDELSNLLDNFPLSVPIPHWDDEACSGVSPDEASRPDETNRDSVANSMGIARQDWKNMHNIY